MAQEIPGNSPDENSQDVPCCEDILQGTGRKELTVFTFDLVFPSLYASPSLFAVARKAVRLSAVSKIEVHATEARVTSR